VAGMVLSESEHNHQALSDIVPLRDIFGLLFFASVGMLLEPAFLRENLPLVLGLVAVVTLTKGLVMAILGRAFGYGNVVPLALGLTMFQAGEFSFVLGRVGVETGSIGQDLYSGIMAVALLSMFLTPFVSRLTAPVYGYLKKQREREPMQTINLERDELHDHVIIVGAGRMGRSVSSVLAKLDLPFVAIELDQHRLEFCRDAGVGMIYGDATHPVVLEAAGLHAARLLLVTTPDTLTTVAVVKAARRERPDLHVVARAENDDILRELRLLGVHQVVQPQMEAGLEVTRQALIHLDVPLSEIHHFVDEARQEYYDPLRQDPESSS